MSEIHVEDVERFGAVAADVESAPPLRVGDWLDVVDDDGIWNVAQVLRFPSAETVEVTYDCWGDEYNEVLRRDSDRIAPFHTHTWAVKCWAKLDKWPWWPALLTMRPPASAKGAQSLMLEERLLLDFMDRTEFAERCRCWVKKSQILPFDSDASLRRSLSKVQPKKGKYSKTGLRSKKVEFALDLLAKCDARQDFPVFVEGTLPVEFEHSFTRPTKEVRKEMGEEMWKRGFTNNRINHAAVHAYTVIIADDGKMTSGSVSDLAKEADTSLPRLCDPSQKRGKKKLSILMKSLQRNESSMQKSKTSQKRAKSTPENVCLDSTTSLPHFGQPRHGRASKVHKKAGMSDGSLPLYTPPSLHDQASTNGESNQHVPQSIAMISKSLSGESNSNGKLLVILKKLTRLTEMTSRADAKVREIEAALNNALDEFAEKAEKAKMLWKAAYPLQARAPPTFSSQQKDSDDNQQRLSIPEAISNRESAADDSREERAATNYATAGMVACAETVTQSKCPVERLELALDEAIRKYQGQSLYAATTSAELDVVKADLLKFPEVQAAMVQFEPPNYKRAAPTGDGHVDNSLPLSISNQCELEEPTSRYTESVPHRTMPQSPCKQHGHLWKCDDPRSDLEHFESLSSDLLGILHANDSTFCFSVDDNFSVDQWYRELYPKSLGYQRM